MVIVLILVLGVLPVILITWVVTSNSRRPPPPPAVMTVPGAVGTTTVRSVPPTTTVRSQPSGPGRWYADPTARYAQRWWDGSAWTAEVVLGNGQHTADPAPLPDPPPAPPA